MKYKILIFIIKVKKILQMILYKLLNLGKMYKQQYINQK